MKGYKAAKIRIEQQYLRDIKFIENERISNLDALEVVCKMSNEIRRDEKKKTPQQ